MTYIVSGGALNSTHSHSLALSRTGNGIINHEQWRRLHGARGARAPPHTLSNSFRRHSPRVNGCVGLVLTININQQEYLKQAGDTAGAVVVIRPQNQMPFPEDDGIIVSPGHATSVAITQVTC